MIEMRRKCKSCDRRRFCTSRYEMTYKFCLAGQMRHLRDDLINKRPDLVESAIRALDDRQSEFDFVDRRIVEALLTVFKAFLQEQSENTYQERLRSRLREQAHEAVLARIPEERIKQDVRRRMSYFGNVVDDDEDGDLSGGYHWLQ